MGKKVSPTGDQSQVFALVGLLDPDHTARVHQVWKELEVKCGLKAVRVAPYPHFSFHVAQQYRLLDLDASLTDLTRTIQPFTMRTSGISVFTGHNPVIYIPVAPSETLLQLHQLLWEKTSRFGTILNTYYRPGSWIPHITLLHDDIDRDCINCIFDHYLGQTFAWEIKVTQMAVIYQKDGEYGIHKIYPLPGSHHPN